MNAPLLSICIATRNRALHLEQTLAALLDQAGADIELVVADGASSDGTPAMLAAMAARDPRVRPLALADNGGVDRDYDRAVTAARGDYVWLMTDDDLPEPGCIARILGACSRGPDLVVIDASVCDQHVARVLEPRRLPFSGERRYESGDPRLLADLGDHLTFIGATVIRRELWLARAREPYYGSLFIHVGVIFQAPLPGWALAIGEPLIRIRYGLGGWVPRRFEVWMFLWPQLVWSFGDYPAAARAAVCPPEPWRRAGLLAAFRAKGAYGPDEYRRWLAGRATGPGGWIAWTIARTPGPLLNALAIAWARLRGRAGGSGMCDLLASRHHWRRLFARAG